MVKRNHHFPKLRASYLFPEIHARKRQFLAQHPEAHLISLGIGDTTEPIPLVIADAMARAAAGLGTREGYSGYGPEQGMEPLRKKIAEVVYQNRVHPDEVFLSDGSKCDLGRLQALFGSQVAVAIQDPAYPVYVGGSLIHGVSSGKSVFSYITQRYTPGFDLFLFAE
jgi:LL-diaminopimelate aminotransferase